MPLPSHEREPPEQQPQQQAAPELLPPPADGPQQQQHQQQHSRRRPWLLGRLSGAVGGLLCLAAAAAVAAVVRQRRRGRSKHHRHGRARAADGRIPLTDLIRFKERQWFVEELEGARDADANAMVRLAKMYLHGQGCQQNIALAQEWVRKARAMGAPATLDELYATDDPEPRRKLRQLAAAEERRRALRKLNAGAGAAHSSRPQQGTAAA